MTSHCVHFLLCIQLACLFVTSVGIACVQTGGAGSGVSASGTTCSGTQPANTCGLVQATTLAEAPYDGLPLGFCSCPSANAIDYIYPNNPGNNANILSQVPYGPIIACANVAQLCVCDEQGNCYKPYGQLGSPLFGFTAQVGIACICDGGGCHMYTQIICTIPADPNSGLQNIVTGEQFPCSAQFTTTAGVYQNYGTNSPYIRAYSVSCRGCVNNPTCSGTFTTLPQHTG